MEVEIEPVVSIGDDYGYPDALDHLEWCHKWLIEHNLDSEWMAIVPNGDTQLFIDLDTREQHEQFLEMWPLVKANNSTYEYRLSFSKSGCVHIIVEMGYYRNLPFRSAMQAILGSDPKREVLHLNSYEKGELNPVVLIERIQRKALPEKSLCKTIDSGLKVCYK